MAAKPHRGSLGSVLAILSVLILGACSTNTVDLPYDATAVAARPAVAANSIKILSVSDGRKHGPHWLGAIRGPFGSPLKTLNTPVPVEDVVESAFTKALEARGLLAQGRGDYGLEVVINQFDCNQLVRREAHVRLHVSVVNFATGEQVYMQDVRINKVSGSLLTLDASYFAEVEDLRRVANQALQEAVDQSLDSPQLSNSLVAGA